MARSLLRVKGAMLYLKVAYSGVILKKVKNLFGTSSSLFIKPFSAWYIAGVKHSSTLLTWGLKCWIAVFCPSSFIAATIDWSLGEALFLIASMATFIFSCGSMIGPSSLNGCHFAFV